MQWIKVFTDIFANPKMQLLLKERDGEIKRMKITLM